MSRSVALSTHREAVAPRSLPVAPDGAPTPAPSAPAGVQTLPPLLACLPALLSWHGLPDLAAPVLAQLSALQALELRLALPLLQQFGLQVRLLERPLSAFGADMLPAALELRDGGACVLLARSLNLAGQAQCSLMFPPGLEPAGSPQRGTEAAPLRLQLSAQALAARYAGRALTFAGPGGLPVRATGRPVAGARAARTAASTRRSVAVAATTAAALSPAAELARPGDWVAAAVPAVDDLRPAAGSAGWAEARLPAAVCAATDGWRAFDVPILAEVPEVSPIGPRPGAGSPATWDDGMPRLADDPPPASSAVTTQATTSRDSDVSAGSPSVSGVEPVSVPRSDVSDAATSATASAPVEATARSPMAERIARIRAERRVAADTAEPSPGAGCLATGAGDPTRLAAEVAGEDAAVVATASILPLADGTAPPVRGGRRPAARRVRERAATPVRRGRSPATLEPAVSCAAATRPDPGAQIVEAPATAIAVGRRVTQDEGRCDQREPALPRPAVLDPIVEDPVRSADPSGAVSGPVDGRPEPQEATAMAFAAAPAVDALPSALPEGAAPDRSPPAVRDVLGAVAAQAARQAALVELGAAGLLGGRLEGLLRDECVAGWSLAGLPSADGSGARSASPRRMRLRRRGPGLQLRPRGQEKADLAGGTCPSTAPSSASCTDRPPTVEADPSVMAIAAAAVGDVAFDAVEFSAPPVDASARGAVRPSHAASGLATSARVAHGVDATSTAPSGLDTVQASAVAQGSPDPVHPAGAGVPAVRRAPKPIARARHPLGRAARRAAARPAACLPTAEVAAPSADDGAPADVQVPAFDPAAAVGLAPVGEASEVRGACPRTTSFGATDGGSPPAMPDAVARSDAGGDETFRLDLGPMAAVSCVPPVLVDEVALPEQALGRAVSAVGPDRQDVPVAPMSDHAAVCPAPPVVSCAGSGADSLARSDAADAGCDAVMAPDSSAAVVTAPEVEPSAPPDGFTLSLSAQARAAAAVETAQACARPDTAPTASPPLFTAPPTLLGSLARWSRRLCEHRVPTDARVRRERRRARMLWLLRWLSFCMVAWALGLPLAWAQELPGPGALWRGLRARGRGGRQPSDEDRAALMASGPSARPPIA